MYVKSSGDLGSLERYFSGTVAMQAVLSNERHVSGKIGFVEDFSHDFFALLLRCWFGSGLFSCVFVGEMPSMMMRDIQRRNDCDLEC
jgi:hypothetical protein